VSGSKTELRSSPRDSHGRARPRKRGWNKSVRGSIISLVQEYLTGPFQSDKEMICTPRASNNSCFKREAAGKSVPELRPGDTLEGLSRPVIDDHTIAEENVRLFERPPN
jgi:hypothetical protein